MVVGTSGVISCSLLTEGAVSVGLGMVALGVERRTDLVVLVEAGLVLVVALVLALVDVDLATGLVDEVLDALGLEDAAVFVDLVVLLVVLFVFDEAAALVLERRVVRPSIDLFFSIVYNYIMKATKLTKKQLAVLNYIEDFTEENGYSPSYREIVSGLGLSSVSAVAEHVDNLVEKGALKKVPGAARSLEVLDYKHEETVRLFQSKIMDASEEEKEILMKAADILGLDLTL